MQGTNAQGREARDRIGKAERWLKERKKPQKISRRDVYRRGDPYERRENVNKNGLLQYMSTQDTYNRVYIGRR